MESSDLYASITDNRRVSSHIDDWLLTNYKLAGTDHESNCVSD